MSILVLQTPIYILVRYDNNLQIFKHMCLANIFTLIFIYSSVFSLLYLNYIKQRKTSGVRVIHIVLCTCEFVECKRIVFVY